ncbi:MAG: SDR family oxidoreductase [Thermoguttaceae bacterium]|jgi:NAD(P)-dependent dehydrogenase (short-subunit alcohol dehydrogenase family)|nr:SDR family oxidoreductase [Thermoguttaceae bacterium]
MKIKHLFDLTGRSALVTGGSRGLGRAMASALASAGAEVVLASRHEDELRAAAAALAAEAGVRVEWVVADLNRRDDVTHLIDESLGRLGKIDILVNNAGTNLPQPIDAVRDDDWDRIVQLNLTSCMALTRGLVPGMKARRWGRVIHISSVMALGSKEGRSAYSATKSALLGLARAAALELGPFGITVNCIAPGPFATELPLQLLSPEEQAKFAERTALGRWGQPEELAGPVLLLASDAGSFITGSVLVVDGGILCRVF